jgi:hypothetical protein
VIVISEARQRREPAIHNTDRAELALIVIMDSGHAAVAAIRNDGKGYFASRKNVTASMRLPSQSRMKAA